MTTSTVPSPTAATVSAGHVSEEGGKKWERGKAKKGRASRAKRHRRSRTQRWRDRKKEREKDQVHRAEESLQEIDHDSSSLLVNDMHGRIDGWLCRDILIDPGASSNFVRRDWAQGCRLREETLRVPLTVKLAVGQLPNRLMGGVAVKSAEVAGSSAPCTLIAMEQLSHAVILGMPWLKRAGVDLGLRAELTWNQRPVTVHPSGRATVVHSVKVDPELHVRDGGDPE